MVRLDTFTQQGIIGVLGIMVSGLGFLDSFHCEKTSFITFGFFVLLLGLTVMRFLGYGFPLTELFVFLDYSVSILFFTVLVLVGGYLGVLYYRISNGKKPIFVLKFWSVED